METNKRSINYRSIPTNSISSLKMALIFNSVNFLWKFSISVFVPQQFLLIFILLQIWTALFKLEIFEFFYNDILIYIVQDYN